MPPPLGAPTVVSRSTTHERVTEKGRRARIVEKRVEGELHAGTVLRGYEVLCVLRRF
jgi:hypothetical protein